jgi:hypothetical protein
MTTLDRDEIRRIREVAGELVDEHGWGSMELDLRQILADHRLPCGERAERELGDHIVWLLS